MPLYYDSVVDGDLTYSIDKLRIEYTGVFDVDLITHELIDLLNLPSTKYVFSEYPSYKYSWYMNRLHPDGFYICLGKVHDSVKDDKGRVKEFVVLSKLLLDFNPNKCFSNDLFLKFYDWLVMSVKKSVLCDADLIRYDLAVDVPVVPDLVLITGTRKHINTYEGTRYCGRRSHHGYLKIYDKAREASLSSNLTRIEYTFSGGKPRSFDGIVVRGSPTVGDLGSCKDSTARNYISLMNHILALGGDIQEHVRALNPRTWKKIQPFVCGGYEVVFSECIIDGLLERMKTKMFVTGSLPSDFDSVESDEDFVDVDDDFDIFDNLK